MIHGLVITHGKLGDALIETAQTILGPQTGLQAISSKGLGPGELMTHVKNSILNLKKQNDEVLVMVDLLGGNTWNVAFRVAHELPPLPVVAGVNLGMILSFCTKREGKSLLELAALIVEDGKRHIVTRSAM